MITDLGVLTPDESGELALSALYPGATVDEARAATGWPLRVADTIAEVPAPTAQELDTLRRLHARTQAAHARPVAMPAQNEPLSHRERGRGEGPI